MNICFHFLGKYVGMGLLVRKFVFLNFFRKLFIFIQTLKITFHLHLLKNIGYIPHVVQNIIK